jgi:DNA polymerase III alpha subunit
MARTLELGQPVFSGIEHGYTGNFGEAYELAKKNNVKLLLGSEAYFVKDRLEKDAKNSHLILLAKNETGRKDINKALSDANKTGFYYKARTDFELIEKINPKNVWVTTACIGGIWKYEDSEEILVRLHKHFGDNLFLEVQTHNKDEQKELNKKILELSVKYGIEIIAGMDSHIILPEQSKERDNYLLSRGISYPDEEGWNIDFPSYDEAMNRFKIQGVLSEEQAGKAMGNTLIFELVQKYDSIIFNDKMIKMPSIYPDLNKSQKDTKFVNLIYKKWDEEKKNVPEEKWRHYELEIAKEIEVVVESDMADYFLLDEKIVSLGKEMGGSITLTGRGSAPGFYIMKLLGMTTVDRISATVKLYPERFITKERILETGSLPDVDLNLGNPQVFAKAQEIILGVGHSYPMIAFQKFSTSGSWKTYARAVGVNFDVSNDISEILKGYDKDLAHYKEENPTDEDLDYAPDISDYLEEKYVPMYEESKIYLKTVNTITPHPCAYLLYSHGDMEEEFGLIKIKDKICVNCDGKFAEKYKLLKNDLLKVSVVDSIYKTFERIGISPIPLPELLKIVDQKTWDIYKNGLGIGINQVEKDGTIQRVSKYSPTSISDLSAFVAAIRPGFKSNYAQFEAKLPFNYGVKSLDEVIQTDEFKFSYMIYQENAMSVMSWAGIPIKNTYEVVKSIAKKRYDDVKKYKEVFIEGMKKRLKELEGKTAKESLVIANMTWQIIEDSSRYSFNAAHAYSVAGDSIYNAWQKANYPVEFYETFLRIMEEDGKKDRLILAISEAKNSFGINFPKMMFGQDNRQINGNTETKEIVLSLKSIKGFGSKIADDMWLLYQEFKGKTFVELLICADENKVLSSKFEQLIKIGYFEMFGKDKKLINILKEFKSGKNRYSKTLKDATKEKRIVELKYFENYAEDDEYTIYEKIQNEFEILSGIQTVFDVGMWYILVEDLNLEYSPKFTAHVIKTGQKAKLKVSKKVYKEHPFQDGSILLCKEITRKSVKRKGLEDKWEEVEGKFEKWLDVYYVMGSEDEFLKNTPNPNKVYNPSSNPPVILNK